MSKHIFFNRAQQKVMFTAANTTVFVGGRRLGKSFGVAAPWLLRNVQTMPGCTVGIIGASFKQLLTRTLPGTLSALEHFGYKRGVHWDLGRKPPRAWGMPKIRPVDWTQVLAFYNGSISVLISQDREGSTNSMTLDALLIDEAKLANFTRLKEETFPANGGFRGHFGTNPWHHSTLIISDMPTKKKGSWFLGYREKCDQSLIDAIQAGVYERWRLQEQLRGETSESAKKDYRYRIRRLSQKLSRLRAVATYYEEFSSIQNIEVLGTQYISRMRRELPPLVFISSILCKRLTSVTDGFYSNLQERHYYDAADYNHLDQMEYDFDRITTSGCLSDGDIDFSAPLLIAFDFNANINWLVVGQRIGSQLNVLKSFYVKYERKLPELCADFCAYYSAFLQKRVCFYYDATALGSNYAVSTDSFAGMIISCLQSEGWDVTPIHLGKPESHAEKYRVINLGLAGHGALMPRFNRDNNEALILALEQAGCYNGTNGIHKDKRGEKLAENEEDKLEYRTDGTDAFDTLYLGALRRPPFALSSGSLTSDFLKE